MNIDKKKRERVHRLLRMHSNRTEQLDTVNAGDIAVFIGFKQAQTGDTIGSEGFPVILERMHFPEPVISVAIEPETLSQRDKLKEVCRSWPRRIPPSSCARMRIPVRSSSRAWVSFTSRSSSRGSPTTSRSARASATRRSPIGKASAPPTPTPRSSTACWRVRKTPPKSPSPSRPISEAAATPTPRRCPRRTSRAPAGGGPPRR